MSKNTLLVIKTQSVERPATLNERKEHFISWFCKLRGGFSFEQEHIDRLDEAKKLII